MDETHTDPAFRDILSANQAFYDAFASGKVNMLEGVWARDCEITVIHPGWAEISGRQGVMQSWRQILEDGAQNPIKCRSPRVYRHGSLAYVICHEVFPEGELIATNIFIEEAGEWRMVHHQAGPGGNRPAAHGTVLH